MRVRQGKKRVRAGLVVGVGIVLVTISVFAGLAGSNRRPDNANKPGKLRDGNVVRLHNGWKITPAGSQSEEIGDLLENGVVSPDGKWLAFVNAGASAHQVHLADANTGKIVASLPVERAQSMGGVAFSPDGSRLYVAGGNTGQIYVCGVGAEGTLTHRTALAVPGLLSILTPKPDPGKDAGRDPARQDATEEKAYLGGLAIAPNSKTLVVANVAGDSLFALDADTGKMQAQHRFADHDRPGAVSYAPDGKTVYVALWGRRLILALDTDKLETRATWTAGAHPNALLLNSDGSRLFVSCGNDDAVYAFDTSTGTMREKINMRLTPRSPAGATPSSLALSPDQNTLYVANSDNNDVAVVNVSVPGHSRVEGFIPTTWYPTFVATSRDGKRLFVGSGKGLGVGPNDKKSPVDPIAPAGSPYIVALLRGILSTIETPDAKQLAAYTRQVYANSPYADSLLDVPAHAPKQNASAIPSRPGQLSPIKHVLYIIKENRTYDQVFGDMTDAQGRRIGDSDPQLCLFGEEVTPNHHALAREFVLLDNFYANGEVSVDGHHWSNAAYVPDAMQRTWPSEYGGKGGTPIRYGDFGDPLADTPGGRLWDLCERAGLSYRTYYYHVDKRRSDEWRQARMAQTRDYIAADIFIKDVAEWEKSGAMPRFMVMALSEDHTTGTRPGTFTPKAAVASNDLGIGKIVEACSKSRFWKEMAIFIVEDDAQNGPDHVDAHRTVALVASPYTRRGIVDSTMYSTCSLLRTMELILGLPPMSQYDAAATPLYASFAAKPDTTPYACRPARMDLNARNTRTAVGAAQSARLDLSEPDHLTVQDEDVLNRVLWHSIQGTNTPYPGINRRPLFTGQGRSFATAPGKDDKEDKED